MSGIISLSSTEVFVGERDGQLKVTILRTGDTSLNADVTYDITGDSATAGPDFSGSSGVVRIPAGADRATVTINILNDSLPEPTETLAVSIVTTTSGTLAAPRTMNINILDDENPVQPPAEPPLQPEFDLTTDRLATGLMQPTDLEISPVDPTIGYLAFKGGQVRMIDLTTGEDLGLFIDLSAQVNEAHDRGLLDMELHPDFPNQPYIYLSYTADPPEVGTPGGPEEDGRVNRYNHLVRITADPAEGYAKAVDGSEVILVGDTGQSLADIHDPDLDYSNPIYSDRASSEKTLNPDNPVPVVNGFKQDYWRVDAGSHVGGALAFGPDGMLYLSTGDGASANYADPRASDVQALDSLAGKILRIDPLTGDGRTDNPFYEDGMSLDSNRAKVWQLGLRNPFSMEFNDDGRLFISETGWRTYEEINSGSAGANFGWPWYEGGTGGTLVTTSGYRSMPAAQAFYDAVNAGIISVIPPYVAMGHAAAAPGYQMQAITGGVFLDSGSSLPDVLDGDYLFADFVNHRLFSVDSDNRLDIRLLGDTAGEFGPVDLVQGPDGTLYFVELGGFETGSTTGAVGRVSIKEFEAAHFKVGVTEAETLDLSGYEAHLNAGFSGGGLIKLAGKSGTASGVFAGEAGNYRVNVDWVNEPDGVSNFAFLVNGAVVSNWSGIGGSDAIETQSIQVALAHNDKIEIRGTKGGGEYARIDKIGIALDDGGQPPPPPPPPPPAGAAIGIGLTEAENLDLSGYEARANAGYSGGELIKVISKSGVASGIFAGDAGAYRVDVDWVNEPDGVSKFAFLVNGGVVSTWSGIGGADAIETQSIQVALARNDKIEIQGTRGDGEFARIDKIDIALDNGNPPPPPPPPPPAGAAIGIGLTEAEDLDLSGYEARSNANYSGGGLIKLISKSGTASGIFAGDAGDYRIDVDWVNEPDGVSNFAFLVNGTVVSTWSGIGGTDVIETQSIQVALAHNGKIEIRGTKGGGEYARIDSLTVHDDGGLQPALLLAATDDFVFADAPNAERQSHVQSDMVFESRLGGELRFDTAGLAGDHAGMSSPTVFDDGMAHDFLLAATEHNIDDFLFG